MVEWVGCCKEYAMTLIGMIVIVKSYSPPLEWSFSQNLPISLSP